ncbi:B-cell receptor CD22-like isoform X3 [Mastacembelus armatus]|uniref:B-cell receptor CD22-like isoform X3 n=1 Tax=Mastacembelus armatus TaxID=205130 RepID=UPI000E4557F5|nr:B-cell receptor CD22-like isoform X3 [Mastacembelus armatus]
MLLSAGCVNELRFNSSCSRLIVIMDSWILMILVIIPGVWSGDWRVTFKSHCALKGESVLIKCEYDYPYGHIVTSVSWSKAKLVSGHWRLFSLSSLPSPPDHKYVGNYRGDCSLEIRNVQHTDEGGYFFSFVTTLSRWRSKTYSYLTVKDLIADVPSTVTEGDDVRLTCMSGCPTATTIVWFKDGELIQNPVFKARREDTGSYYCATWGQERVRSASVALNVQYAPKNVTLTVSPSGDVRRGSSVTFSCSSHASPPVTQSGYSLYKDGQLISSGLNHTISDMQPNHSGWYHCQARNNISRMGVDLINSTKVHIIVQYGPMNTRVSVDPPDVVVGSSVNLTCSSVASPAADNYTWYKRTDSLRSTSLLQVGSGQVLSLQVVEKSHSGAYLCVARNSLGENNSTEVLLTLKEMAYGRQPLQALPVLAGIGASVFLTFVIILFFWRKHRDTEKKQTGEPDFSFSGSSNSTSNEESESVYANVYMLPHSLPPVTAAQDITSAPQRNSHYEHDVLIEDEVTYSAVTIKPRNPSHLNNRVPQNPRSRPEEHDVIYATVVKSS